MSDFITPTLGRTVLFTLESGPSTGQQRPAIVVATDKKDPSVATLQVFTDGDGAPNVGDGLPGVFRQAKVPYSEEPKPGTWSRPTRGEPPTEQPQEVSAKKATASKRSAPAKPTGEKSAEAAPTADATPAAEPEPAAELPAA